MASVGSAFFGFDFGTSNSSIGSYADGGPRLIGVQQGRTSIPTAMFFSFEDGEISFGFDALARYLDRDPGRLMRSLKGVLGSSLIHEATQVAGSKLRFIDVISLFISYMREAADNPRTVVLGRPVRFVDDDDDADEEAERQLQWAAEQAGFTFVEFQFEPIAAALDYERSVTEEQLAFVADIGGGTSDFSIVRVSPFRRGKADRLSDILGCSGVHIGGTDFDKWLSMSTVMPLLGLGSQLRLKNMQPPVWWYLDLATWHRINVMYDPRVATDIRRVRQDALEPDKLDVLAAVIEARRGHEILAAVERAKIGLSQSDATVLDLSDMVDCGDLTILRQQLDELDKRRSGQDHGWGPVNSAPRGHRSGGDQCCLHDRWVFENAVAAILHCLHISRGCARRKRRVRQRCEGPVDRRP